MHIYGVWLSYNKKDEDIDIEILMKTNHRTSLQVHLSLWYLIIINQLQILEILSCLPLTSIIIFKK